MHAVVRQVFGRLATLNPEDEERKLALIEAESPDNELKMNVQTSAHSPSEAAVASGTGSSTPSKSTVNLPEGNSTDVPGTKEGEADQIPSPAPRSECTYHKTSVSLS